jgi:hypothetical protein
MIDNLKYNNKPTGKEIGSIVNRLGREENVVEISVKELANKIIEGYSIKPAICGRKQDEWQEQQVFMVDVDDGLTIEQAINKSREIDIVPTFIYTSFSHTEKKHKFRLVFVVDEIITNIDEALAIQNILNKLFNADEHCKNLNRIYFGGRSIVYENYNSVINVDELLNKYSDLCYNKRLGRKGVPNKYNINNINYIRYPKNPPADDKEVNYNIQAIKEHNIKYLKTILGIDDDNKIIFETQQQFLDYIFKIDLAKLLNIDNPKSFKCIFHDDNNPSASIFQDDETGNYIYKCNSNSCGVSYNIIGVIERLGNFKSRPKTYKFIKELFNLEIMETEWQKEQKEILIENLKVIYNGELEKNCPQAYKNNKNILRYLEQMHLIALDNIYNEKLTDEEGNVLFFASRSYIADKLNLSPNSLNKISQKLVVLAYHKLLNKLDDNEIPESLLKKSKCINIKYNDKNFKHINYFSIPSYTYNLYAEIEQQGKKWKDNHYTMKGVSREMFFRAEGKEVADKLYPQYKKITNKQGKEVDRTTTKTSDKRTAEIVKVIFDILDNQGYVTEREIVEKLKNKFGKTKTEIQIKRSLQEILDGYGLKKIRTNKEIKKQYGVVNNGYPFIIVKFDNYI